MGRVVWETIEPLLPPAHQSHPLGCHQPRVPDERAFPRHPHPAGDRLVVWVDIEVILRFQVSDTTLRARRDDWIDGGMFDVLAEEALAAYDEILELDPDVVVLDGSIHKAPCGGEGTGKSPVDWGRLGWKWSVAADSGRGPDGLGDRRGEPHDVALLDPNLDAIIPTGPPDCSMTSAPCRLTAATTIRPFVPDSKRGG